jgi:hypothetical protein
MNMKIIIFYVGQLAETLAVSVAIIFIAKILTNADAGFCLHSNASPYMFHSCETSFLLI